MLENRAKLTYIGIGSNLGNRKKNIEKAKFHIIQNDIEIIKSSSYYESLSWPDPKKPKFLNIVIKINTKFKPLELLKKFKTIEYNMGRKKSPKNSPRICDIDLIDYDKSKIKGKITLPHPRMHKRNFVLIPLFEINREWTHPKSKLNIKKLIFSLSNRDITSIKQI